MSLATSRSTYLLAGSSAELPAELSPIDYHHLIEESVDQWNRWRADHPTLLPEFCGADLSRQYLFEADLRGANLREANLSRACLVGADLRGANLTGANLTGAYLSEANLLSATLHHANLQGASLKGTHLSPADLWDVQVDPTELVLVHFVKAAGKLPRSPATGRRESSLLQHRFGYYKAQFEMNQAPTFQPLVCFESPRFSRAIRHQVCDKNTFTQAAVHTNFQAAA